MANLKKLPVVKSTNAKLFFNINIDDVEEDGTVLSSIRKGVKEIAHFHFDIASSDYSCSLLECGSFRIKYDKLIEKDFKKLIVDSFNDVITKNTYHEGTRTLFFTTVGTEQEIIGQAVTESKLFTLVKEFKNSTSRRINKLYISNNF